MDPGPSGNCIKIRVKVCFFRGVVFYFKLFLNLCVRIYRGLCDKWNIKMVLDLALYPSFV